MGLPEQVELHWRTTARAHVAFLTSVEMLLSFQISVGREQPFSNLCDD